jgi:hypothetical protein
MANTNIASLPSLNTTPLDTDLLIVETNAGTQSMEYGRFGLEFVGLSGTQNIADVKTFTSIPVLPASNPTTDNQTSRKAYVDTKVGLSGNETIGGTKTFSIIPELPNANPTTANQASRKTYVDTKVGLSGNETIDGTKTFSTIPVLPASNPTTDNQASRKAYVDTKMSLSGNETVAGIKTFSSFSVTPSSAPTADYQVANKKYVDDNAGGGGGDIVVVGRTTTVTIPASGSATTVFTFPFEPDTFYTIEMFLFFTGGGIQVNRTASVGTLVSGYAIFERFDSITEVVQATGSDIIKDGATTPDFIRGTFRYNSPSSGSTCDLRFQDTGDTYSAVIQPGSFIKVIKIGAIP